MNGESGLSAEPKDPPRPQVSVVIPALNEAMNLPYVLPLIPSAGYEVILVDGRSVDDTMAVALQLRPDVRLVTQTRRGKGNALACGFALASGDIIAMVDADGSADPREIPRFVQALLDGADFAKGTRYIKGGGSSDLTWARSAGNRMLSILFNICYRRHYTDLCYGFNVFWRRCVPAIALNPAGPETPATRFMPWGDGFEVETLIHIRAAKAGFVIAEVPSFERPRVHGNSNLRAFADGMRVLRVILTELRSGRRRGVAAAAGAPAAPAPAPVLPTPVLPPPIPSSPAFPATAMWLGWRPPDVITDNGPHDSAQVAGE
jgi:glycosyltransferase involved in cell wall biosynthesis